MSIKSKYLIIGFLLSFITFAHAVVKIKIQHWQTPQGTPVYFVQNHEIPMVDIVVVFDAGSRRDGVLPGLANITAKLIDQGTHQFDADTIAEKFDELGSILEKSTNRDMVVISLRSLSQEKILKPSIDLFSHILSGANFPQAAFKRQQQITLQEIRETHQEVAQVANQQFFKAIYNSHPYSHPSLGTIPSVTHIKDTDLKNFYQQYYVAHNALVAIVGDLTPAQAKEIANTIMAQLPQGKKASHLPKAQAVRGKNIRVNFPTTQTNIRMGTVAIARQNPDYFPLILANYNLGGDMVSRLFREVRGKYGLSYDVNSYILPLQLQGPFLISLQTKTAQTQAALRLTEKILNQFISQGLTEAELNAAKDYLSGSFPLRIDSNSDIVSYLTIIGFYHLPLDYLNTFNQKINAVTLEQVNQAIKKYINLNNLTTVIVGSNETS